jgi:hypothetical protein
MVLAGIASYFLAASKGDAELRCWSMSLFACLVGYWLR